MRGAAYRWAVAVLAWLLTVPFAGWVLVRLTGTERGWLPVVALSFTPYATVASLAALAVAVLAGAPWAALFAALSTAMLAAGLLPRALPCRSRGRGTALRVMTANLYHGAADPVTLVRLVDEGRIDLLAMQEYTPGADRRLLAAGLADLLPHRVVVPLPNGYGSALFSRYPLDRQPTRVNPGGYRNAAALLSVPGWGPLPVESAHPAAPYHHSVIHDWYAGQAAQPPATPDGPPRLLLGDFNATLDHAALRRLLRGGYRDAACVTGRGLVPTWRHDRLPLPGVALDHILVDRRIAVAAAAVHRLPGSDHRAVSAELFLPSAAADHLADRRDGKG